MTKFHYFITLFFLEVIKKHRFQFNGITECIVVDKYSYV